LGVVSVRREREPEDLLASWTIVADDWNRVANKTGTTSLGFAAAPPERSPKERTTRV
jgi:hypothetical protein